MAFVSEGVCEEILQAVAGGTPVIARAARARDRGADKAATRWPRSWPPLWTLLDAGEASLSAGVTLDAAE